MYGYRLNDRDLGLILELMNSTHVLLLTKTSCYLCAYMYTYILLNLYFLNITYLIISTFHTSIFKDLSLAFYIWAIPRQSGPKKWSSSISCIDFFDSLILFWPSTSWKGLWISLYIYGDCHPTSEIAQLTVNNTCGTIWSNVGQKRQFLVMCVHSEQENYSTKWYSFVLMINAWLIWHLLRKSEI